MESRHCASCDWEGRIGRDYEATARLAVSEGLSATLMAAALKAGQSKCDRAIVERQQCDCEATCRLRSAD